MPAPHGKAAHSMVETVDGGAFVTALRAKHDFVGVKVDIEGELQISYRGRAQPFSVHISPACHRTARTGAEWWLLRHLLLHRPGALCAVDLWLFEWHPGDGMDRKHGYIFTELEAVMDWLLSDPQCPRPIVLSWK